METKKQITENEALVRLSAKCAATEYCCADIRRMMQKWDLTDEAKERIIARLQKERYIDERRYARAFVRDKFRYNKWGLVKIGQQLRLKGIDPSIIDEAKEEVDSDASMDSLRRIIEAKRKSVKGKAEYEINAKLCRFALSRGFSMNDINKVLHSDFGDWT